MPVGEFEIKLQVPAERLAQVEATFASAPGQALHAVYFDTAEGHLRRQRIALRLRREGDRWVQTAKAATDSMLARLEHNAVAGAAEGGDVPLPDLRRHAGTPVGEMIERALAPCGGLRDALLAAAFEVKVHRRTQIVRSDRATIEVAFDRGAVVAGEASWPLCEVELELKSGDPGAVLQLARTWCAQSGLWLSTVSKAERGALLSRGALFRPPVPGAPVDYPANARPRHVTSAILAACLAQVVGNASEVAAGSMDPDHIHQLRVGLRRLRTALKDLPMLKVDAAPAWDAALATVFRGLGEHRDRTHVLRTLEPRIQAAGGPPVSADRPSHAPEPARLVQDTPFQLALLDLLALAHAGSPEHAGKTNQRRRMKKSVRRELSKLHGKALGAGQRFLALEEADQHRVRKQLKRLRYLTEMVAPLFGEARAMKYVRKLKPAQETLGTYNDSLVAHAAYRELAPARPEALFGLGWLSARRESEALACAKALRKLGKAKPYW